MKIIVFYHSPKIQRVAGLTMGKAKDLIRFCAGSFIALGVTAGNPGVAHASLMKDIGLATFGAGGPGVVIGQLMLLAVVGWLFGYIASAVGKGQISGLIHMVTLLSCVGIVVGTAFKAISDVLKYIS